MTNLSPDLFWLAVTGVMTAALWMPHVLKLVAQEGIVEAFKDPHGVLELKPAWAKRSQRAHINAQLNFGLFAGLVLTAHIAGVNTADIGSLAMVYFFVRLGHYLVYTLGIPFLRPNLFAIGAIIQIIIALKILQIL